MKRYLEVMVALSKSVLKMCLQRPQTVDFFNFLMTINLETFQWISVTKPHVRTILHFK